LRRLGAAREFIIDEGKRSRDLVAAVSKLAWAVAPVLMMALDTAAGSNLYQVAGLVERICGTLQ
jgi:hypothetical protein